MAERSANDTHRPMDEAREPSDHSLLRRYRNGEQGAATELYLRYASRLFGLARRQSSAALASRVTPDDVVQSVFRTFFRRVSDGGYDVPPGDELWQLLLVLALNKIRSLGKYHGAARRNVAATFSIEGLEHALPDRNTADDTSLRILEMTIEELVKDFQPSQQEMIRFRIEGHTVPAIAELTQRSQRSVERVLQKFRSMLSKQIYDLPNGQDP